MKKIKVGSDFSGVGAFNQALNRLKIQYEEVYSCDWDKYARQTFIANYGEPKYYPKDVYEREIPKESLDIYMTSPPCQAFSLAGKRLGKNDEKGRGILFFNSLEFIEKNRPRFFIFENVKGLLSDDGGNTFNEWLNYLGGKSVNGSGVLFAFQDSVPYHIYWKVLNAKDYGVPQNRERVFIIGIRDDQDNNFTSPPEEPLTKRLKDVLEPEVEEKYYLSEKMLELITYAKNGSIEVANINKGGQKGIVVDANGTHIGCLSATDYKLPKLIMEEPKVIQLNQSKESGGVQPYQHNRVYDTNGIMTTLDTGSARKNILEEQIVSQSRIRKLTPIEAFRLMDFPDTLVHNARKAGVSDSQLYKQAGNSIVVSVLCKIIERLKL
jgi:DNA (cytosine-5)-methyltransferase 1